LCQLLRVGGVQEFVGEEEEGAGGLGGLVALVVHIDPSDLFSEIRRRRTREMEAR